MAPHGEIFCMEVRGTLMKREILGAWSPHGDLPATGLELLSVRCQSGWITSVVK